MKTPCQIDPEAWVGSDERQRQFATRICLTECPALTKCRVGDFPFTKPGPEDHGVWAGVDLSLTATQRAKAEQPLNLDSATKQCLTCGNLIRRDKQNRESWEQARYCSRKCYGDTLKIKGLPESKTCELCGAEFTRGERSGQKWVSARFCGVACAGKARRKQRAA